MDGHQHTTRGVHSAKAFASILNRERDRTDRTGQEFSLVVFETGAAPRKSPSIRDLVTVLSERIRSTDDIGWFGDGRIAVALPHTPSDAARKFVDNVRKAFPWGTPPPECAVYAYPSRWIPQAGGETGKQRLKVEDADAARPLEEMGSHYLCPIPLWKRAIDVTGALAAIILLSPLLLMVALLILIVSPGPIFFRQERVGYLGRPFTLWKFRTMHVNADTTVHKDYLHDLITNEKEMVKLDSGRDYRIIPFGSLLRATGIDELPQLLNVLLGEMSLIGPRPCLPYEAREFLPWQMRRFDTLPGLTGLWQVSGKNRTTFKEMMRLDIGYARRRALLLDAKIVLLTPRAIFRQVVDRPSYAGARAKALSTVLRVGAVILTILSLNKLHK